MFFSFLFLTFKTFSIFLLFLFLCSIFLRRKKALYGRKGVLLWNIFSCLRFKRELSHPAAILCIYYYFDVADVRQHRCVTSVYVVNPAVWDGKNTNKLNKRPKQCKKPKFHMSGRIFPFSGFHFSLVLQFADYI